MKAVLLSLIRLYQAVVSPMLGVACRYEPTCSAYAHEAIERHGAWRGVRLATARLSRCRPGGGSGWDPVPGRPTAGPTDSDASGDSGAHTITVTSAAQQSPPPGAKVTR